MKCIAVIPIRSGSKRFPNKNIYEIHGVPLFVFAANQAKISGVFDNVIISSDSQIYLDIANNFGYETHYRSNKSSSDIATSEDVIDEVIRDYNLDGDDWVFLVQATCPFQNKQYFQDALSKLNNNINSVVTYINFKRFFIEDVVGRIRPMTQDLTPRMVETGLFWATNVSAFMANYNRIIVPYDMVLISAGDDLDIDYYDDLKVHMCRLERLADKILQERLQ